MKKLSLILFLIASIHAQVLISPFDALKLSFTQDIKVDKKSILLSRTQALEVQKMAKVKLKTKLYKIFKVTHENKLLGYGVLVTQKVRSKDTAILSIITPDGVIKAIEIIAFNEPPEFIPSKVWVEVFRGAVLDDSLELGKKVPNISGSTFSARSATDASRIALAIYDVVLKKVII